MNYTNYAQLEQYYETKSVNTHNYYVYNIK